MEAGGDGGREEVATAVGCPSETVRITHAAQQFPYHVHTIHQYAVNDPIYTPCAV